MINLPEMPKFAVISLILGIIILILTLFLLVLDAYSHGNILPMILFLSSPMLIGLGIGIYGILK